MSAPIAGFCPMCGGATLAYVGGHITCSGATCPRPDAVDLILRDREREHIVAIGHSGFVVRHPLRERIGDALLNCNLHKWIAELAGPPRKPGRYRVIWWGDPANARWSPAPSDSEEAP